MTVKKNYVLRERKGDLSKKWYVEYIDRRGKRKQKYGNINKELTALGRRKAALALIEQLKKQHLPTQSKKSYIRY